MSNQIINFGCRLNINEGEIIRHNLDNAKINNAIVINTCAVTSEAERQARQTIRKTIRENPDKKIIVTGCSAQIKPQQYLEMDGVDKVLGNVEKLKPQSFLNIEDSEKALVNDIMSVQETAEHLLELPALKTLEGKSRAFIQVQNGCDHRCTFCIIPYGRGNSRSVPVGDVANQVTKLVAQGYKEVVFTGVDITSYGEDLPAKPKLGQMIKRVLSHVPDLKRVRLGSIDPVEVDEDIFDLIENEPRFMPHLHISLQAGDDMILKRMKRRHLRKDVVDFVQKCRRLNNKIAFGADIIAGFPTETDEMFENTRKLISEIGLVYLHIFAYSEREGTPATKMPKVDVPIRKARAKILREEGQKELDKFLKNCVGQTFEVLLEENKKGQLQGKTENFAPVKINNTDIAEKNLQKGDLITVTVKNYEDGFLNN